MKKQDYEHHIRYYTPHHFIFYPIVLGLFVFAISRMDDLSDKDIVWLILATIIAIVAWFSFMTRQHYALTLQNRVIRLEMRLRYFQLTGHRFEQLESQLTFAQLAALRFASDDELPALTDRTLKENLEPRIIKKSIKNWIPDTMRV